MAPGQDFGGPDFGSPDFIGAARVGPTASGFAGDITIVWDPVNFRGDWSVANGGLVTGNDLQTAVLVSLFTWRVLPPGSPAPDNTGDRRGWWADSYNPNPIGSRLWTLFRAKKADAVATLQLAQDICLEALQWLLDDNIAASLVVDTQWLDPTQLGIRVRITKPDGTTQVFNFAWAWQQITN